MIENVINESDYKAVIDAIQTLIHTTQSPVIIGIAGHGAAGKTTLSHQLKAHFGEQTSIMHTDPYIISGMVRKQSVVSYEYDGQTYHAKVTACHPEAHHTDLLKRDITMLRMGMDIATVQTHYQASEIIRAKQELIIIEGMSVAFLPQSLLDYSVYLYTNAETEFARRSVRDISERGMSLSYLQETHADRRRQYDIYMHPYAENFTTVINTSTVFT